MPQISPINWIYIIISFSMVFIMIMTSLPNFSLKKSNSLNKKLEQKLFPW